MKRIFRYLFDRIFTIALVAVGILIPLLREAALIERNNFKSIFFVVSTYILFYILSSSIEIYIKNYLIQKRNRKHFPRSYSVVKDSIIPNFEDNAKSENNLERNKNIDKIIKSPIDYTNETLAGNQAPIFNPNDKYLDEIFDESITHIVAITAENPNLWLDPTLCFYMTNCCALSLIRKFNECKTPQKLIMIDLENEEKYKEHIKKETEILLKKLKLRERFEEFEFIRFLLFSEENLNCLQNTVFPSLKATQDLFRIKSFFLNKEKIKANLNDEFHTYVGTINLIWDRIYHQNPQKQEQIRDIVEKRKQNNVPEFLFLFYPNQKIVVHTYISGMPLRTELSNSVSATVHTDYEAIQNLIAYLANCRINIGNCDWYPQGDNLNNKKSFIDIV